MTDRQLVIDASVLAKIYLKDEEFVPVAEAIADRYADGSLELVVPQYILYEIPSAVDAAVRQQRLDPGSARQAIRDFFKLNLRTVVDADTLPTMIQAAHLRARQLGCRMYDALCVVVAEVLKLPFVTADRKLYSTIKDNVGRAVWIGDYEL